MRTFLAAVLCGSLVGAAGLAGCDALPGSVGGADTYRVTAEFADVLDLVPQSAVKVDDVTVGAVERVELRGYLARVTLRVRKSVVLPANAVADLRQSSLLGEKFVALSPPSEGPVRGRLGDGAVIPVSRTGRNVEIEEILSALSLLLSGGGLEQLRTINTELGKVMTGREPQLRAFLTRLDDVVGTLDSQKADIVRALEGVNRLMSTVDRQRKVLAGALDSFGPGLKVLADQRAQLMSMLAALSNLGEVGTRVIRQSAANTVADLNALRPILSQLSATGSALPGSLELLLTYPFPRTVDRSVFLSHGRWSTNLYATLDLDLTTVLTNLLGPVTVVPGRPGVAAVAPGRPGRPGLPAPSDAVPTAPGRLPLPTVPGLPTLPGIVTGPLPDLGGLLMGGLTR